MSRPFRLATVLRVREIRADQARAEAALAARAATEARADVLSRSGLLTAVVGRSDAATSGATFAARRDVVTTGAERVRRANADADDAKTSSDAAARRRDDARTRVRAIEILAERHRRRVRADELAAEQAAGDEVALRPWQRRTGGGR